MDLKKDVAEWFLNQAQEQMMKAIDEGDDELARIVAYGEEWMRGELQREGVEVNAA